VLLNYAPVTALTKENGRASGVMLTDAESGNEYQVKARCVINATGPFTDAVRRLDDGRAASIVAVSQGIHLVLDVDFLPGETAIMVPRTEDGRVIFMIPWHGRALIGTTDTPQGHASAEPEALDAEIDYVLEHAGRYLERQPAKGDILSVFAGLRPLVRGSAQRTASLSRDHHIEVSASGLVTVAGGKWTTYRRMAEDAVNQAESVGGLPARPCATEGLRLHGAESAGTPWGEFGATLEEAAHYESRYPGMLHPRLPYSTAMAAYVIDNEMPARLEDVLSRRLRALLLDARAAVHAAPEVADLMARLQGRSPAWAQEQVADFQRLAAAYLPKETLVGAIHPRP
jgi:glycerol-3-phosphate dehydrogenase